VRTPEELLDVKAANEKPILVANDETKKRNDGHSDDDGSGSDDGSDGDGRMWALFTRKCHWLGPCVATHVPEAHLRDGADTPWIVRGVPELNIKDVEVFPTSQVVDAARKVLKISDRGVLVAELVKYSETNETSDSSRHSPTVSWREISRGFVLPPDWDPWPTALRVDPFRRRYERQIKTAENVRNTEKRMGEKDGDDAYSDASDERFGKMHITPKENHIEHTSSSHETEVVFDEMYPDREDVEALGDDVRVGPRRVFKGAIGWKTERDDRDGKKVSSVSSTVRVSFSGRRTNRFFGARTIFSRTRTRTSPGANRKTLEPNESVSS
jgi:hypothetical protein